MSVPLSEISFSFYMGVWSQTLQIKKQPFRERMKFSTVSSYLRPTCVPVKAGVNQKGVNQKRYSPQKQWNRYSLG